MLVTGVLTKDSLAFAVADLAQREGAELVLTGAGRGLSLTTRTARKLSGDLDVLVSGGDPLNRPDLYDLVSYAKSLELRTATIPAATDRLTPDVVRRFKDDPLPGTVGIGRGWP